MIIAAIIVFGLLLLAWLVAPGDAPPVADPMPARADDLLPEGA